MVGLLIKPSFFRQLRIQTRIFNIMNNSTQNLFSVKDKVIIITGASVGLGAHFAKLLADAGAMVAIGARRLELLNALTSEIKSNKGTALPIQLDITDEHSIENFITTVEKELGQTDVLINNAGLSMRQNFLDMKKTDWQPILDLNLKGTIQFTQTVVKRLVQHKKAASIVNISSALDVLCIPNSDTAYTVSKAGILQFTQFLALELGKHNIRVNTVSPGLYPMTEQNYEFFYGTEEGNQLREAIASKVPLLRLGEFDDLNGAILFLCSNASAYVTGTTIRVDGGLAINKFQ